MNKGRLIFANIVGVVVVVALVAGFAYYYYQNKNYVKTDEATVTADMSQIVATSSGQLKDWDIKEGEEVSKDDKLGKLFDGEKELSIVSMDDGKIIKNAVKNHQVVQAGDILAQTADMDKRFITANIKETDLKDIDKGDSVDITVDGDEGTEFEGKVEEIGYAANSVFSKLPQQSSGNYTKVTQKVAVKISIQNPTDKVLPGMNAEVKISL